MLSRINDAIRLRIISGVSRFNDLPRPVQGLLFVGLLVVVVIVGRWSGALSKGRSRVYWGR